jgi:DNA-binding beta-propeller fold protein YncE
LLDPLPFTASDDVRAALANIGRTEDVAFSPDERRLAIAGYTKGTCLVFDIDLDLVGGRRKIALSNPLAFTSPNLDKPHGLSFLDSRTLVVADRAAEKVSVFSIPPRGRATNGASGKMEGDAVILDLTQPSSVAVAARGLGRYDVLVCSNNGNSVSCHRLVGGARPRIKRSEVLVSSTLNLPDGVAISSSRRWIAVSNHNTRTVQMFRNSPALKPHSPPDGVLYATGCPHGVRFTSDGAFVLVADAGGPFVRVYRTENEDWRGVRRPVATTRVMTEEVFRPGHYNRDVGGPKGIAIDRGMNFLAATCDTQPLAFFDLPSVLKG